MLRWTRGYGGSRHSKDGRFAVHHVWVGKNKVWRLRDLEIPGCQDFAGLKAAFYEANRRNGGNVMEETFVPSPAEHARAMEYIAKIEKERDSFRERLKVMREESAKVCIELVDMSGRIGEGAWSDPPAVRGWLSKRAKRLADAVNATAELAALPSP